MSNMRRGAKVGLCKPGHHSCTRKPLLAFFPSFCDRGVFILALALVAGKFYRHKSSAHPHTNMAKAALNMMTRTSAAEYREVSGVWMNAVDTGWINDENPLPAARRTADAGFQTPLDEVSWGVGAQATQTPPR